MLVLDGSATIADVVALADRRERVSVAPTTVAAVERAHQLAAELSARFDIYGRTTGVGANRATAVSPTDSDYGMRLLRSHAVDAGDPLDDRTVRAMLACGSSSCACLAPGSIRRSSAASRPCSTTMHFPSFANTRPSGPVTSRRSRALH